MLVVTSAAFAEVFASWFDAIFGGAHYLQQRSFVGRFSCLSKLRFDHLARQREWH